MKNVLIAYATREGQTEKIARRIQGHLQELNCRVVLHNTAAPLPPNLINQFDLFICGASMHAGGIESELLTFINKYKTEIQSKQNAFFLVLLSAATKDPKLREEWLNDARKKMLEQLPIQFQRTEMIAGALMYSKYPWPLKWFMRRIARKAGEDTDMSTDHEYTDWNQVRKYAASLASDSAPTR